MSTRALLRLLVLLVAPAALVSTAAVALGAGPGGYEPDRWEVPVKAELVLAPGWGGHLRFVDNDRGIDVGQLDKPRQEERQVALPPGRYRIIVTDDSNHAFAFTDVELGPGSRLRVSGAMLRGLALPPPPPSAAQRVAMAAAARPSRDQYPRGLAARPLTLAPHLSELILGHEAHFNSSDYISENSSFLLPVTLGLRWAITDRVEMRDLGVYGTPLIRDGHVPAIGVGVGLSNIGFDATGSVVLVLSGWLDIKEHLTDKLALQAGVGYDATVFTSIPLADHHVTPSLQLYYDAASMFSLIAGLRYDWTQITQSVVTQSDLIADRVDLLGGFHVSPGSWIDIRATVGPSWARLDGGSWVTWGRLFTEVRFRF